MSNLEVDGTTTDGLHYVVVKHDPEAKGVPYGKFEIHIDGVERTVSRAYRLRDGGTTFIKLVNGGVVTFPRAMSSDNRIPTYNGLQIIEKEVN